MAKKNTRRSAKSRRSSRARHSSRNRSHASRHPARHAPLRTLHGTYYDERKPFNVAKFGQWIFFTGVLIAVLAGAVFGTTYTEVIWVLGALGLIVGLINMALKDEIPFLIAVAIILISTSSLGMIFEKIPFIGAQLMTVATYLNVFVVPAGFIIALKSIFTYAEA